MDNKNYFIFVLGYDLLHDRLNGEACDISYDICENIYDDFRKSTYYDLNISEYDALQLYVKECVRMPKNETVNIPKRQYERLINTQTVLNALNNAGVDNWEGYGIAMESLGDDERDVL